MTDEQRIREQFDAFVYERTVNRDKSGPWPTPTELAWLAWQARDAEVQALREALESVHYRATRWAILPTVEAHQSVLQDIGKDARAALAGGEQ